MKPLPAYAPPRSLREEAPAEPSEIEVQALWFEQLFKAELKTDDGRSVRVVQPGFWNHRAGPDFSRAALQFSDSNEVRVGSVEVHLRPVDWHLHGHHADAAYEDTILHVVWDTAGSRKSFPATAGFRRVPQVELGSQLVAPWAELQPLCAALVQQPLPAAVPGRCSPILQELPPARVLEIIRTAGLFRIRQRARRWYWRRRLTSPEQALFEALAEALGFHANQVPMRLVAQRLPFSLLRRMNPPARLAHLFGLSGFLPEESLARLQSESRTWLRELWEIWWKARGPLDYAILSRGQWKLAGLRPLNRPERRLAALAQIVPLLPQLLSAVETHDSRQFAQLLLNVRDAFWEQHATLAGPPLGKPCRLMGEERVHDMLINIFWPMVSLEDPGAAEAGLADLTASTNGVVRIAIQRTLVGNLSRRQLGEALVQQGLLQIFRDYCMTDCTQCRDCTFPELVRSWQGSPP